MLIPIKIAAIKASTMMIAIGIQRCCGIAAQPPSVDLLFGIW